MAIQCVIGYVASLYLVMSLVKKFKKNGGLSPTLHKMKLYAQSRIEQY